MKESVPKVVRHLPRQDSKSALETGIKATPSKKVTVTTLRRGDCFGELALLDEMGFGLDLSRCAVSGRRDGLAFISPRTGRAVHAESAGEWADRLLPLPDSLRPGSNEADTGDILAGLQVTGFFLAQHLARGQGERPIPAARARFVDLLARRSGG